MKLIDPEIIELAGRSGIYVNKEGGIVYDNDDPLASLVCFYHIVTRHERLQFGQMLARVIERERKKY